MDYIKSQKIIQDFESNVDVVSIKYNDVSIWPILKNYLTWGLLKFSEQDEKGHTQNNNKILVKNNIGQKIKFHFTQIHTLILSYLKYQYALLKYKLKVEKFNILCIDVSSKLYEDNVNGKRYSRYFSPYVDFLKEQDSLLLLNTVNLYNDIGERNMEPYFFNAKLYFSYNKIFNSYLKKICKSKLTIHNFNYLSDYFKSTPYNNVFSQSFLTNELEEITIYESFWIHFLKIKKPQIICLSCHYGNRSHYGMLSAAKKLKIKTVEIQHGVALSELYAGYYKTQNGGYNYLPSYYWCWSKFDAENIIKSRKNSSVFSPIVGGNLWLGKSIGEQIVNDDDVELDKILKKAAPLKIVLVTLQHSMPISDILIEAIEKTLDKNIFWLIRFHPRDYIDPGYREKYINALANFTNVEYTHASKASIYNILKYVDFHVTHFSNVAVEAISFNVPTILLGDRFRDFYKDYINAGVFFIGEDGNQICKLLIEKSNMNFEMIDRFKMQYENSVAVSAFSLIKSSNIQ